MIALLVLQGNDNELFHRYVHGTIDADRQRNRELSKENENLRIELAQVKLEINLERQNKFSTNNQKQAEAKARTAPLAKKCRPPAGIPVGFVPPRPSTIERSMFQLHAAARTAHVLQYT